MVLRANKKINSFQDLDQVEAYILYNHKFISTKPKLARPCLLVEQGNSRANCKVKDCGQALTGCEVSMQGTASALPPCPQETRCNYAHFTSLVPMQGVHVWPHAGASSCSSHIGSALPPCPQETRCNYALWYQCKAIHCTMPMQVWIHAGGSSCSSDVGLNVRQCTVQCAMHCTMSNQMQLRARHVQCASSLHQMPQQAAVSVVYQAHCPGIMKVCNYAILRLDHTTWLQ